MSDLRATLERRCGHPARDYATIAVAISRIPYGRPSRLTAEGVLDEWRGTCSTKHVLLAEIFSFVSPELSVALWHRPYLVTREFVAAHWGPALVGSVPAAGLVDVHTFATIQLDHGRTLVDVTFPLADWDGVADTLLACGPGSDVPAGADPLASKAALVVECCDPEVREPFIAGLTRLSLT